MPRKRKQKSKHKPKQPLKGRARRRPAIDVKVFAALSLARREHLSLENAAKIEGTTVKNIVAVAPSAIEKHGGTYRVKPFDRISVVMNVLGPKGESCLVVRSSRSRSLYGKYLNAVKALLYKNDASALAAFRGKKVGGQRLITDIDRLKELAGFDLIGIDRLYEGIAHGR